MRALAVSLILLLTMPAAAQEQPECDGPYKDQEIDAEELKEVLAQHWQWLSDVDARNVDFNDPDPRRANLCGAILTSADLSEANLFRANLSEAYLESANLSEADLVSANLSEAYLWGANLSEANLFRVNLSEANLYRANLSEAYLESANLSEANLESANLSEANLRGVNLSEANLFHADLSEAIYEPEAGKQPPVDLIATATGLSTLRYEQPRALVNLRKQFMDTGYREQERQITHAIRHGQTAKQLSGEEGLSGKVEGTFNYVFFELTTKWGMEPGRALIVLMFLVPFFAIPYLLAIRKPNDDGIWQVWSSERMRDDLGTQKPALLKKTGLTSFGYALYFSLLSAFHIGWRDLNVGNWIARIQPREYTLRASGWVRTVSGIQSLISVYLLAMWALTYFGRPFQ